MDTPTASWAEMMPHVLITIPPRSCAKALPRREDNASPPHPIPRDCRKDRAAHAQNPSIKWPGRMESAHDAATRQRRLASKPSAGALCLEQRSQRAPRDHQSRTNP